VQDKSWLQDHVLEKQQGNNEEKDRLWGEI
jgi:hypothetical protein